MQKNPMRKAFSMITAIFVIVLMASVSLLIMNISGKMVKETTTQFQREQAMLLANSYTEFAMMSAMANDQNSTNCLNEISGIFGDYQVNASISYIASSAYVSTSCNNVLSSAVATKNTPLQIIVDIAVSYPDYDHPNDLNMTYRKRSLLKI